jgi:3-oxoacyl-[acyl-carrier protein] reductase
MNIFGDLNGKTALVCGASQGLGAATASTLAAMGCRIIAVSRSETALKSTVQSLTGDAKHCYFAVDLCDVTAVKQLAQSLIDSGEAIHILINNGGGPTPGPSLLVKEEDVLEAISMHLLANIVLSQALIPGMQKSGFGRIINIVSVSARSPVSNLAVSNTVRGAVLSWAKSLANEVASHGITVNSVLPGYTLTSRLEGVLRATADRSGITEEVAASRLLSEIPAGRFGEPRELAAAVAYFASTAASYTTGTTLAIDGGWSRAT